MGSGFKILFIFLSHKIGELETETPECILVVTKAVQPPGAGSEAFSSHLSGAREPGGREPLSSSSRGTSSVGSTGTQSGAAAS